MCLIFCALNAHSQYPVIIAANRDEFYNREAQAAHFWLPSTNSQEILAGRDTLANGTWLGVNRQGGFAAITNFQENDKQQYHRSRGELPLRFLSSQSTDDFTDFLIEHDQEYAGFNCIYGHLSVQPRLYYWSNRGAEYQKLNSGVHGLSNAFLNTDWKKVTKGKKAFNQMLKNNFLSERGFQLMSDRSLSNVDQPPQTEHFPTQEHLRSARFIHSENYGTRCSTFITVDRNNTLTFSERGYTQSSAIDTSRLFNFPIR